MRYLEAPSSIQRCRDLADFFGQFLVTCVHLDVVLDTRVHRQCLMAGCAQQSALSLGFPIRRYLWVASHADPEHFEACERIIPSSLVSNTVKCNVVKNDVDTAGDFWKLV
jgi:hypothetical protein